MNVRYQARVLADRDDIFRFLNERSPTSARKVLRVLVVLGRNFA